MGCVIVIVIKGYVIVRGVEKLRGSCILHGSMANALLCLIWGCRLHKLNNWGQEMWQWQCMQMTCSVVVMAPFGMILYWIRGSADRSIAHGFY